MFSSGPHLSLYRGDPVSNPFDIAGADSAEQLFGVVASSEEAIAAATQSHPIVVPRDGVVVTEMLIEQPELASIVQIRPEATRGGKLAGQKILSIDTSTNPPNLTDPPNLPNLSAATVIGANSRGDGFVDSSKMLLNPAAVLSVGSITILKNGAQLASALATNRPAQLAYGWDHPIAPGVERSVVEGLKGSKLLSASSQFRDSIDQHPGWAHP